MTTRRAAAPTPGEDAAGPAVRLDRRGAVLLVLGGAVAFLVASIWLVPWSWVPGGRLTPMPVSDLFTADEVRRAEEFARLRRWLGWASYAVSLLLAVLLGLTPLGARLTRRVVGRLRWWLAVPVSVVVLLVIGRLATLPLSLRLRQQNLDYGLTRQSLPDWFADVGRSLLVSTVTASLLVLMLVALARLWPRRWYLGAAVGVVALSFAGSLLYPVLVEPLFNRFTSMPAGPFKTSVLRLAEREAVRVDDVLVADASRRTTTLNAYVSGIGGTRRVVVYDTLLEGLSTEEARVVIAHELAHAKHEDVLVGTTLGALGGVAGVGLLALLLDSAWLRRRSGTDGPADPAVAAAVLALVAVGSLLASPVSNTVSRAIETRADRVSLAVTGDGQAFIGMQRRLALEAFHDPTPPAWSQFWFGSHPTVLQRAGLPASLVEAEEDGR